MSYILKGSGASYVEINPLTSVISITKNLNEGTQLDVLIDVYYEDVLITSTSILLIGSQEVNNDLLIQPSYISNVVGQNSCDIHLWAGFDDISSTATFELNDPSQSSYITIDQVNNKIMIGTPPVSEPVNVLINAKINGQIIDTASVLVLPSAAASGFNESLELMRTKMRTSMNYVIGMRDFAYTSAISNLNSIYQDLFRETNSLVQLLSEMSSATSASTLFKNQYVLPAISLMQNIQTITYNIQDILGKFNSAQIYLETQYKAILNLIENTVVPSDPTNLNLAFGIENDTIAWVQANLF
ncbi:MAG: hypothetical protein LBQ45_00725 [Mycoplasmataceae bacterium]|nr:hypothetical protein [Mycoplasmataceae bacterium]